MNFLYFSMLRLTLADLDNSLTLFNKPQLCKRRRHELTTEPLKLLAAVYSIIRPVDSISDTTKKPTTRVYQISSSPRIYNCFYYKESYGLPLDPFSFS